MIVRCWNLSHAVTQISVSVNGSALVTQQICLFLYALKKNNSVITYNWRKTISCEDYHGNEIILALTRIESKKNLHSYFCLCPSLKLNLRHLNKSHSPGRWVHSHDSSRLITLYCLGLSKLATKPSKRGKIAQCFTTALQYSTACSFGVCSSWKQTTEQSRTKGA